MDTEIPEKDKWIGDRTAVQTHMTMIQTVVARMATASASCKTWCLTLVGAITSLAGATHQPAILGYVVVAVVIFWFLDVRYLAQEKAYRYLFNKMASKIGGTKDTYYRADTFNLKAPTTKTNTWDAFCSWSMLPYPVVLAAYGLAWQRGWLDLLKP